MKPLRLAGYALVGVWSAWWLYFAVAAGIATAPAWIVAAAAFLLAWIPTLAWRWPRAGAALLAAEGLFLLGWVLFGLHRNLPSTTAFLVLTLAAPPLLAGLLVASGGKTDP